MKRLAIEKGDTKKLLMFVGVILFLAYLARENYRSSAGPAPLSDHKVNYVISGGGVLDADLTYINSSGGTQQENFDGTDPQYRPEYPSHFEIEVERPIGASVYMSAQLKSEYSNKIHVAILVDGKLLQEASSTGSRSIATASGLVQ